MCSRPLRSPASLFSPLFGALRCIVRGELSLRRSDYFFLLVVLGRGRIDWRVGSLKSPELKASSRRIADILTHFTFSCFSSVNPFLRFMFFAAALSDEHGVLHPPRGAASVFSPTTPETRNLSLFCFAEYTGIVVLLSRLVCTPLFPFVFLCIYFRCLSFHFTI